MFPAVQSQQPRYHQIHTQGFELALPKIYSIYNLIHDMKSHIVWNQSHRIFMTQGKCRIVKRSFSECPVFMVYQKPEALNLPNNTLINEQ